MSRRFAYRVGSVAAALIMLFIPAALPAKGDDIDPSENSKPDESTQSVIFDRSNSYLNISSQYEHVPFGEKEIALPIVQSKLINATVLGNGANDCFSPVIKLNQNGSVSWDVDISRDSQYYIQVSYCGVQGNKRDMKIELQIDGKTPFKEADGITLSRLWSDATEILRDERGNDLIPRQSEIFKFQTVFLQDSALFTNQPFSFLLTKGKHTISIKNIGENFLISSVSLCKRPVVASDDDALRQYDRMGLKEKTGAMIIHQAEQSFEKSSQSIFPQYDRTSPATVPYHVSKIRRNVIGKNSWNVRGDWISWKIDDVPEDGLYYLTLKFLQNEQIGLATYRTLYVNGKIPSKSFENISFDYDVNWANKTVSDENGKPVPVYLKKGTNEIKLVATLGEFEPVFRIVDDVTPKMSDLYIRMVMVCGSTPDIFRDYHLEREIPDLIETMQQAAIDLHKAADLMDKINKSKSSQSAPLRRAASQLESMVENPDTIPTRIANYRDTISTLSDWLYSGSSQPLTLDYIIAHSSDAKIPDAKATMWQKVKHFVGSFLASFTEDYDSVSTADDGGRTINVWANMGRDQVQLLRDLVIDDFTPKSGISVNLSLVQTGFIEAILAGAGPDVAVGIARGQPVNLASRGALIDLSKFDGFEDVVSRFSDTACVPYTFDGGIYALPNTQSFYMMFYRKDILSSLNLSVPNTWDEVSALIARLQKRNMTFGLPYTVISAATAVDTGMGAKDMYSLLLLQKGVSFYKDGGRKSALDSKQAGEAFTKWCDFYVKYGFDLVYDFYTRFRYGEMPIGIANFEMYNQLIAAAPEIRGLWDITTVPGTVDENGNINRSVGGAGSAVVMFKSAKNPKDCFSFIDWWTTTEVQANYGVGVENILGPAGRYSTANTKAFEMLPWTEQELSALTEQRGNVKEIMEVPGSYFVSRCLDNAFRAVLYDNKNALETLEKEVANINREIARKRKELKLD
ncbi:MAG: extracellular solute-binding protein [Oscillospiraceae bacterium]|nr:extracellular solute-binding protein [Oscillospiraceae bacterium]